MYEQQQQQLYVPKNSCFLQVILVALGTLQSQISVCTTNNYAKGKLAKSRVKYLLCVPLILRRWHPDRQHCSRDLQCHL